jgi:hypothetical protein
MGGAKTGLVALVATALFGGPADAADWRTQALEPGSAPADVAIDANGNAVAVWTQDLSGSPLRVSYRPAGRSFEAPQTLDECAGVSPAVDVDAQGNFTVLWVRCEGTVRAVTGPGDGGFDSPVTVAPAPPSDDGRTYPDLDVAPSGSTVAAWQTNGKDDSGQSKTRAEAALRAPGGSWGAPETISPGPLAPWTLSMSDNVDVGIDSGGAAVVLFRRWRLDSEPNLGQMFGSEPNYKIDQVVVGRTGDGFGEPRTINENGELESPRLAVGSDGGTLISWIVPGSSEAIGAIAGSTADPLAGAPYEAFRSQDQDNSNPRPYIDGQGRAYIVFARNGIALIEAAAVAGPWGSPQIVSSGDPPLFESAVSEAGEIAVATYTAEAARAHVRLAGAEDFVHSQSYDGHPALAAAVNAGRAVAMWTQPDRFAAVYDDLTDARPPRCDVKQFRHRAGHVFSFVTECDEASDVSAIFKIRRTQLGALTKHVRADRTRTLRLRTARKGRRAIARAAAHRDRVIVKLVLTATDAAGNSQVVRRRVAILADE